MVRDLLGNVMAGRIGQGRFVLLSLVVIAFGATVFVLLGVGASVASMLGLSDDPVARPVLDLGALVLLLIGEIVALYAMLNIAAKRARDIGWNSLLMVVLLVAFNVLVWIVLAIVPGRPDAMRASTLDAARPGKIG